MATRKAECRLAGFLVTSFILEIMELLFEVWILYYLYSSGALIWFAVCTGVMVTSLVGSQLLSCQIRKGGRAPEDASCIFFISHVVLAGLCWRYGRLAMSCHLAVSRAEIWHCFAVNVFNAFTRSFPLLFITTYLILKGELSVTTLLSKWLLLASALTSLLAIVRTLIMYRKPSWICCVSGAIAPPGSALMWKIPWRVAEVLTRILSVGTFAIIHGYWILLVFGLHWLTALSLLVIDHVRIDDIPEDGNKYDADRQERKKKGALLTLLISSYIHVFLGFNVTSGKSRLVTVLYLVLCCAESLTLTALWLLYESRHGLKIAVASVIACSQLTALVCAIGYYSFRLRKRLPRDRADDECYFQCLTCRLSDRESRPRNILVDHVKMYANPEQKLGDRLPRSEGKPLTSRRPTATRSRDSNQRQAVITEADLSWDDYDLKSHSGAVNIDSVQTSYRDDGRANLPSSGHVTAQNISRPPINTSAFRSKLHDPGYFSGISSSSSKDTATNPGRPPIQKPRIPLFPNTCNGYWSDDNSSTVTSISSCVHFISHNQYDGPYHSPAQDSYSLNSSVTYSTSTTFTSQYTFELAPDLELPVVRSSDRQRDLYRQDRTGRVTSYNTQLNGCSADESNTKVSGLDWMMPTS